VDPANGNIYAVWQDARFSDFRYSSIAFSMSTDGGFTWSAPIQVNQTPDIISTGNRQAFLPSVAVNQDGVVAVTYYDFRNNTPAAGLPTDYWIVHAHPSDGLTSPASWSRENRLTNTSFNMENAPVNNGYFLGDYQGLVGQGRHFGAFFSMPSGSDLSSVFYRDPLPVETPSGPNTPDHQPGSGGAIAHLDPGHAAWRNETSAAHGWFFAATPTSGPEITLPGDLGEQRRADQPAVRERRSSRERALEPADNGATVETAAATRLAMNRFAGGDSTGLADDTLFGLLAAIVEPVWIGNGDSDGGRQNR
jgi:hypothetical protein